MEKASPEGTLPSSSSLSAVVPSFVPQLSQRGRGRKRETIGSCLFVLIRALSPPSRPRRTPSDVFVNLFPSACRVPPRDKNGVSNEVSGPAVCCAAGGPCWKLCRLRHSSLRPNSSVSRPPREDLPSRGLPGPLYAAGVLQFRITTCLRGAHTARPLLHYLREESRNRRN